MSKKHFDFTPSTVLNTEDFLKGGKVSFPTVPPAKSNQKLQKHQPEFSDKRAKWEKIWCTVGVRILRSTLQNIQEAVANTNRDLKHPATVSEVVRELLEERFDP